MVQPLFENLLHLRLLAKALTHHVPDCCVFGVAEGKFRMELGVVATAVEAIMALVTSEGKIWLDIYRAPCCVCSTNQGSEIRTGYDSGGSKELSTVHTQFYL